MRRSDFTLRSKTNISIKKSGKAPGYMKTSLPKDRRSQSGSYLTAWLLQPQGFPRFSNCIRWHQHQVPEPPSSPSLPLYPWSYELNLSLEASGAWRTKVSQSLHLLLWNAGIRVTGVRQQGRAVHRNTSAAGPSDSETVDHSLAQFHQTQRYGPPLSIREQEFWAPSRAGKAHRHNYQSALPGKGEHQQWRNSDQLRNS